MSLSIVFLCLPPPGEASAFAESYGRDKPAWQGRWCSGKGTRSKF